MPSSLVSIIVPAYNMEDYIGEALASVASQSHPDWELIVVEDASHDGTKHIVENFAARHPNHRIEYHRHETNRGVSATRNTAISHARGEFLAFLDPDDYWSPNHLAQGIQSLAEEPPADVSASPARKFRGNNRDDTSGYRNFSPKQTTYFPSSLALYNFITLSSTVVRRSTLDQVGTFDETPAIQHVEDWDLWLRISQAGGRFRFCKETTCHYRLHDAGATANQEVMWERQKALVAKHRNYIAELQLAVMGFVAATADQAQQELDILNQNYGVRVIKRLDRFFAFLLGRSDHN